MKMHVHTLIVTVAFQVWQDAAARCKLAFPSCARQDSLQLKPVYTSSSVILP
jgi:hypothetical protein